ncbi:hypothetical protein K8S19_11785 [bacterium]|nr:hypothetical protein [bacterium]
MMVGFLIGMIIAGYMYLHSRAIGFTFPNIDGLFAVRPTFVRIAHYLAGRWVGYCLLGFFCGWLGSILDNSLIQRLLFAVSCILLLFVLLFFFTNHSPELPLAETINPRHLSIPLFLMGLLSTVILIAPLWIACFLVMGKYPGMQGVVFFTYVFLGYAFFSIPLLLNIKWKRVAALKRSIKFILTVITVLLLAFLLHEFIRL